jgi:uracil-DNA glycosylase family 4
MIANDKIINMIRGSSVRECVACPLVEQTTNGPIPGVGNLTGIVGVGRNPGADEDQNSGRPFSGPSGRIMDQYFLENAGISRDDMFLTNLALCYTTHNDEPLMEHVKTCTTLHLFPHLKLLNPYLVIAFGGLTSYVLTGQSSITQFHGSLFKHKMGFYVIPCLHPGSALYDPKRRNDIVYDAVQVRRFLENREKYQEEIGWL